MPGLDPGIHDEWPRVRDLRKSFSAKGLMDCRVKPGNDSRENMHAAKTLYSAAATRSMRHCASSARSDSALSDALIAANPSYGFVIVACFQSPE